MEVYLCIGQGPDATPEPSTLVPLRVGDKFGFSDVKKQIVIPARYEAVDFFAEGLARVLDGKWGFINVRGEEVIPRKFDYCHSFSEGVAICRTGKTESFIDKTGQVAISINNYHNALPFSEGLERVCADSVCGFIDKRGKLIIPLKYNNDPFLQPFRDGLAIFHIIGEDGDRYTKFVDKTGKETIVAKGCGYGFRDGLMLIQPCGIRPRPHRFVDKLGNVAIPRTYRDADYFSDGVAAVLDDVGWWFIDTTGKRLVRLKYDLVFSPSENLASVQRKGKWGYINKMGRVVIPLKYGGTPYGMATFSNGFAWVRLNGKLICISKTGKEYYRPIRASKSKPSK